MCRTLDGVTEGKNCSLASAGGLLQQPGIPQKLPQPVKHLRKVPAAQSNPEMLAQMGRLRRILKNTPRHDHDPALVDSALAELVDRDPAQPSGEGNRPTPRFVPLEQR